MPSLVEFFDIERYHQSGSVSTVVVQSALLAMIIAIWTAVLSFRAALKRHSAHFVWLGIFSSAYALWNLLYLISYTQRELIFSQGTLTAAAAHKGQLMVGLILPLVAYKFMALLFFERQTLSRLTVITFLSVIALYFLPIDLYYNTAALGTAIFVVIAFSVLFVRLWRVYSKTENLKLKTRSFFVLVGVIVCAFFSFIGQLRTETPLGVVPLPYIGNILTAVFLYFLHQMVANPRLREIRELMLRGIRILLLTLILSSIFIVLLLWVGKEDYELFVFNTFIASFIILSVLEPLREKLDAFFLKQFIVDRYEFEELLKKLSRKIRMGKTVGELSTIVIEGIRESGRIYQAALFLWDQSANDFRLQEPSNLNFKTSLSVDYPWIRYFRKVHEPLLMEHDQDFPADVREALREMHTHIALPLMRGTEILGIWALRSSLRSTNPYTSFSDQEVERLAMISQELVDVLDQLQHFEGQERQKKLAALGEMSAALAHEIRNPLGAIHGATQLLETSPTLMNGEDKECVGILRKEVDRMQKTVNQYLNFARSSDEPVATSLDTLIRKMIQDVNPKAKKTNSQIHIEVSPDTPPLVTDPLKLEQVLFNLVQNACEAFSKNVWVRAQPQGAMVSIQVKDDGPGMPPHVLPNVFTPLFTTKKAGSGLGLPICKKMIDSLGGSISVDSAVNEGTTFTIQLPVAGQKEGRLAVANEAE